MSKTGWKNAERDVARKVRGRRYGANTGGRIDVESEVHVIQVKERKTLSLREAEAIAVEMERIGNQKTPPKIGSLWVKRSAGRGVETPWLVVMTESVWKTMNGRTPREEISHAQAPHDQADRDVRDER